MPVHALCLPHAPVAGCVVRRRRVGGRRRACQARDADLPRFRATARGFPADGRVLRARLHPRQAAATRCRRCRRGGAARAGAGRVMPRTPDRNAVAANRGVLSPAARFPRRAARRCDAARHASGYGFAMPLCARICAHGLGLAGPIRWRVLRSWWTKGAGCPSTASVVWISYDQLSSALNTISMR